MGLGGAVVDQTRVVLIVCRGQEQPGDIDSVETQEQQGLLGPHHLVTPAPWNFIS